MGYLNTVGRYGTAYLDRAAIARRGLGALPREDAIYLSITNDAEGPPILGRQSVHDALREGRAAAGERLLVADALRRRRLLRRESDQPVRHRRSRRAPVQRRRVAGSLQHDRPADEGQTANWLPAPAGSFNLDMRLYWPKPEVLAGTWTPPIFRAIR